jgi:hypothetical protein
MPKVVAAAFVFLIAGIIMVFCNGRLARGISAGDRALADRIGVEWIRRWFFWPYYQSWFVPYGVETLPRTVAGFSG